MTFTAVVPNVRIELDLVRRQRRRRAGAPTQDHHLGRQKYNGTRVTMRNQFGSRELRDGERAHLWVY